MMGLYLLAENSEQIVFNFNGSAVFTPVSGQTYFMGISLFLRKPN